MKKSIITLSIVLISLLGYSQATNVGEFRIANATTAFGVNLPVGTKIYNIATGEYWVVTTGVAYTATLDVPSGSFTQLNGGAADQNLNYNATTHTVEISGGTNAIIPLAVDDGATKGLSSFTTADFTVTSGNVAIDYANGQAATNAQPGFATAAQITDIEDNNTKETNVSTDLSLGSVTATTMDVNSSDGTNATLTAATTEDAGLMTDVQFDKLAGIEAGAEVNLTMITKKFEEASTTPTAHTLSPVAVVDQGCRVSLNGATLDPAKYTFATGTITIGVPVYQYDQVVITYSY